MLGQNNRQPKQNERKEFHKSKQPPKLVLGQKLNQLLMDSLVAIP
jgi:hypothetical protein